MRNASRLLFPVLFALLTFTGLSSFCGFYVARADAKLLNKASQVIIARDGDQTVLTMSNDFQGDVKEFAMVVPVPQVLRRDQIKLADPSVFAKLDAYSGPRLVEYNDESPCPGDERYALQLEDLSPTKAASVTKPAPNQSVKVEARYEVGEYEILILSAQESGGLKTWLTQNGYKVPPKAEEVLEPYVKSNLKFFVVKVNLEAYQKSGFGALRPLQISFNSPKFMLPIRLGMANAEDFQDLIIYAFTKKGRIETTNYRTVESPTDLDVPTFVRDNFNAFYQAAWDKTWSANKSAVFVEYAWDLSSSNFLKCDPCPSEPPMLADLNNAGIPWLTGQAADGMGGSDYAGDLYMTRLHLRYDRATFPQDLVFQETPNKNNFQVRYVMHNPVKNVNCGEGGAYFKKVYERRIKELDQLASLTGWDVSKYAFYAEEYRKLAAEAGMDVPAGNEMPFAQPAGGSGNVNLWAVLAAVAAVLGVVFASTKLGKK